LNDYPWTLELIFGVIYTRVFMFTKIWATVTERPYAMLSCSTDLFKLCVVYNLF